MKTALAEFHPDSVMAVGHSTGGAVTLLDTVFHIKCLQHEKVGGMDVY